MGDVQEIGPASRQGLPQKACHAGVVVFLQNRVAGLVEIERETPYGYPLVLMLSKHGFPRVALGVGENGHAIPSVGEMLGKSEGI
ncbi:hypothetical protein ES703_118994 [subsurface metagenome]